MTLKQLEIKLNNLENAFIESQKRNVENTYKAEEALSRVPTTLTKTAYIGDSSITFSDIPTGNISVFMTTESGVSINTTSVYENNSLKVSFEPLEEVATVTISIQ